MQKMKFAGLILALVGTGVLLRAYYLVSFSAGYGIGEADRNQRLFLWGAIACAGLFVACAVSLYLTARRRRS